MIDYDAMSDSEINIMMTEKLGIHDSWDVAHGEIITKAAIKHSGNNVISITGAVDYCNNWSDIGPIIEECMICLEPKINISMWAAYANADKKMIFDISDKSETIDANPKRAAAICFLKMMENKK